jgi:AcrR family transcriptional regulator
MTQPKNGTRTRIQEVALELFAERGYDQTSLREISDRLGLTKAALYYHFKTKDEILASTLEDYLAEVHALIDWAREQPRTVETRNVVLLRYSGLIGRRLTAMRFMHQDQKGMQHSEIGERFKAAMGEVNMLLTPEDGGLLERMRALSAVVTLHVGALFLGEQNDVDPDEARAVALQVAEDLVASNERVGTA